MPDPSVQKLAEVLVHYSLELRPGQQSSLRTNPIAEELALAVFREAVRAGAHVFTGIKRFTKNMLFDEKTAARSTLPWAPAIPKRAAKTTLGSTGTCSVIWRIAKSPSMAKLSTATANL